MLPQGPFFIQDVLLNYIVGRASAVLCIPEGASIGQCRRNILTAVRAVFQRVHLNRNLVAGLYRIRFPALLCDLTDAAHFK